jgi:hypothetical protein
MKPRITISRSQEGKMEVWVNEAGRDLLVHELQRLSERSDHFHLSPEDEEGEVPLQTMPYRNGDQIIDRAKVLLRTDAWDAEYFPHVLPQ